MSLVELMHIAAGSIRILVIIAIPCLLLLTIIVERTNL